MNTITVAAGPVDTEGNERILISEERQQWFATPAESRAYVDSIVAQARAMTAAERYDLDAELTELVNAKGRVILLGPRFAIGPNVFVGKQEVGKARARVRMMIETDLGGAYDRAARFPGLS